MKVVRKIIQIDKERCDGCGLCVPSCAEGALQIVDGKAKIVADVYCDGLGACLGECPNNALKIVEREADEFDEEAVHKYLAEKKATQEVQQSISPCGCPSAHVQMFDHIKEQKGQPYAISAESSELWHWPIKIKLIPPKAPFLKGANLLVAADCCPAAYPTFQKDFIQGRALMIGCPKFDDKEAYVQKFAQIFKTCEIKDVTCIVMEVPCCSAFPAIIKKGMELAGVNVSIKKVVITTKGQIAT